MHKLVQMPYRILFEAFLSHEEASPYCYLLRKYELGERKQAYQWEKVEGLPSRIKAESYSDLPKEAQFHKDKETDLRSKYIRTLANTGNLLLNRLFAR